MARNRVGLQVKGLEDYMAKLDELGGSNAMKKGAENALKASKEYVNPLIEQAMTHLPAGGRYSHGNTEKSIDKDTTVEWAGLSASVKVGFDFSKSGLTSIFLMYGTPKHNPVAGLYEAIYGSKTQREIGKIQGEELTKVIKELMEG